MGCINGQQVLVTGAGGFIGSHLVEQLVTLGAHVQAFVRYTSRPQAGFLDILDPHIRASIEVTRGDLRDYDAVVQATQGIAIIFHLGALIGIPYSYVHPYETVETNVIGTLNILIAGRRCGVQRIVHTSSSEVYGTALYVPMDEGHPLQGQSPYSASKIGADKIAESFFNSYELPVVTLRPFNTYGPRQSARAVIPTIITQAITRDAICLGNLSPQRDFTYVTDTVNGFIKAAECDAAVGRVVNLGTSVAISVGDLVEKIGMILDKRLRVRQEDMRTRPAGSEVDRLLSDNRLARELLNWQPEVSLNEGLEKTVNWVQDNLHMYSIGSYAV